MDEQDKDLNLRQQLLRSTRLFVFDEFPSLDREVFEIYKEMN